MRNKIRVWTAIAALMATMLAGTGCVTALASKAMRPWEKSERSVREFDFAVVESGARVDLRLVSGRSVSGVYAGSAPLPDAEYARIYSEKSESLRSEIELPALGQAIVLEDKFGRRFEGEFSGFDRGVLFVRMVGRDKPVALSLAPAVRLTLSGGRVIDREGLDRLLRRSDLPLRSSIILDSAGVRLAFSTGEIEAFRVRKSLVGPVVLDVLLSGGIILLFSSAKMFSLQKAYF